MISLCKILRIETGLNAVKNQKANNFLRIICLNSKLLNAKMNYAAEKVAGPF
jgi:hypothetical protein